MTRYASLSQCNGRIRYTNPFIKHVEAPIVDAFSFIEGASAQVLLFKQSPVRTRTIQGAPPMYGQVSGMIIRRKSQTTVMVSVRDIVEKDFGEICR